ncbi:MAG: BolA family transcriptional regulator [Candidatus Omnitrophica bacterium]|nr:BolA family transcriptional regulator [Candidatus Omnitrophota bacterium]
MGNKVKIEQALKDAFAPVYLNVMDEGAKHIGHAGAKEGGHFRVEIVSDAFNGKKLLERHRMVYAALEHLKSSIHALSIQARQ